MKKIYTYALCGLLGLEVLVFAGFYIRGPQGLQTLQTMYAEQESMLAGVEQLNQEVAGLKQSIDSWHKNPFHKEKIAREQLQMARVEDEVFYLT